MLKSLMEKLTEIQNMKEDREVKTNVGKYGTEYQGDDDEDEDGEPKKKAAPAGEKRGRGRPRKDADNTGHVAKYEVDKKMPAWLKGGDAPKGKPDKKAVKKHSLKDWFEHMDAKMLAEAEAEKSPFKKPNNPNRTPMDSARALAQKGMAAAKAKPSEKIAEAEVDEAFPDASGAETLSYAEYKKRMEKLSDRQLKYDQARHEREYGPDTGERGPLNPANLPRHFRLQAKILRDRAKANAKMKLKPKPSEAPEKVKEAVRGMYYGDKGIRQPNSQQERDRVASDYKAARADNRTPASRAISGVRAQGVRSATAGNINSVGPIKTTSMDQGTEVGQTTSPNMDSSTKTQYSGQVRARPGAGKGIAEMEMAGGSTQPQKYTTAPSKPGGMDIKDQQGKVVATAKDAAAAKAFTDGGIRMTTPDDIQEEGGAGLPGLGKTIKFAQTRGWNVKTSPKKTSFIFTNPKLEAKVKVTLYKDKDGGSVWAWFSDENTTGGSGNDPVSEFFDTFKKIHNAAKEQSKSYRADDDIVYEADIPSASADFGAGLGAGRSQRALEEAKKDKKPAFGGKQAAAFGKKDSKKKDNEVPDDIQEAKGKKPDFLDLDKDGNKKEPMKKAAADKGGDKKDGKKGMSAAQEKFFGKKKTVKEGAEHNHQAARSEGKAHGLRGHSHCGNNYEDMEEARCYHEGFKEGLDEKHGHQYLDEEIPMVAGPGSMVDEEESLNYECSEDFYMEVIQGLIDNNRRNMSPSRKSRVEAYVKKEVTKEGCIFDPQRFEEMYQQIVDFSREIDEAMNDNSSFFNADKRSPIGGLEAPFSSPVDEMMNTIAFESLDRQLNALLDEGMTVSISKGQQGSPDSVSVTASDADSDKLLALVKQAGLGLFGGDEATMHPGATGSNMPSQSAPGSDIAVVDDHDDMMSLIKKVTDGHDDHGHEAGEETCESCGGMMEEGHSCREAVDEEEPNPSDNDVAQAGAQQSQEDAALAQAAGKNFADTDSPLEEDEGMDSVENTPNNDGMNSVERGEDEYADEEDDEEPVELDEATGDQKFDSMMSQMTAEPKYPDRDMLPTSIPELIQWAEKNNKPDHWHFAQWAKKNKFTNVNDALEWFGDNVDPDMPWGPKDFEDPFGRPAAEWLEDAAEHDPKAAELMKVFGCYEKIVFDWPDDYRQMNMPGPKGTDESLTEYANGADDTVESDIDFMINGITGGLNGKKRNVAGNGQSTIPAVAIAHESRLGNPMRESTDLLKDWKKLAGM